MESENKIVKYSFEPLGVYPVYSNLIVKVKM